MTVPALVYRNSTPELLAWAADVQARHVQTTQERQVWMDALYDTAGVPTGDPTRVAYFQGHRFSGLGWPDGVDLPRGWFRPVKTPQLIRPRASNKRLEKELQRYSQPDQRRELEELHGMRGRAFSGLGLYSCGVRLEEDAVWVTWGTQGVTRELEPAATEHGWERVTLVQYLQRFGEEEAAAS